METKLVRGAAVSLQNPPKSPACRCTSDLFRAVRAKGFHHRWARRIGVNERAGAARPKACALESVKVVIPGRLAFSSPTLCECDSLAG